MPTDGNYHRHADLEGAHRPDQGLEDTHHISHFPPRMILDAKSSQEAVSRRGPWWWEEVFGPMYILVYIDMPVPGEWHFWWTLLDGDLFCLWMSRAF